MIPSITPPTDNLYKFISLFGLTIFLFVSYNLNTAYDELTHCNIEIVNLDASIEKVRVDFSEPRKNLKNIFGKKRKFIRGLMSDVQEIRSEIYDLRIEYTEKIELLGNVKKLEITLDALNLKKNVCFISLGIGIGIMLFGFLKWKQKEQDIRDKILEIEHIIKQKERDHKKKIKNKKNPKIPAGPEIAMTLSDLEKN